MTKRLNMYLLMYLVVYLICQVDSESVEDIDTSNVMVSFNPYVSVFDIYNRSRYGVDELVPLVEKVATRFKKIHVNLEREYVKINTTKSLMLVPMAVALYNCKSTTKNKVQVYLELDEYAACCPFKMNFKSFKANPFIYIAENANKLCNGTVTTILIKKGFCEYRDCFVSSVNFTESSVQNLTLQFQYSFGISIGTKDYNKYKMYDQLHKLYDYDVLLVRYNDLHDLLTNNVDKKGLYTKKPCELVTTLILSDTGIDSVVNLTGLVNTWKFILKFKNSDTYMISYAFDFFRVYNEYNATGWWYLSKYTLSENTREYVFEEKASMAKIVDDIENPRNFGWLQRNNSFDETSTGIVSFDDLYNVDFDLFCRILSLKVWNSWQLDKIKNGYAPDRIYGGRDCQNYMLYILPVADLSNTGLSINQSSDILFGTNREIVVNVSAHAWMPPDLKYVGAKSGYAYPLDICGEYRLGSSSSNKIIQKLNELNVKLVLFYFYEDEEYVSMGATRLVRSRIALFEKCKSFFRTHYVNQSVEIGFASLGYFMAEKFYKSSSNIQNYVKYVYLLENWAKNQTNILVFLGQETDMKHDFEFIDENYPPSVGWISLDWITGKLIEKNQEALQMLKQRFPDPNNITEVEKPVNLTTTQIILVIGTSLIGCTLIFVLVIYFMRRHYKNNNLTKVEIEKFYNGDNSSDEYSKTVPYDKQKYEIRDANFKIESEVPLGSGEFGAVYRGIIEQQTGRLDVAVKTLNPQKLHKTQLAGLLSEIKLLAYIGRHPNITELLGANTESLKRGKVYIFLEFCHLGSLYKFLKEMRLLISSPIRETNVEALTTSARYVNTSAGQTKQLDTELSNDLFHWSTEICDGMSFLAEKHVVHADLATRNVLLNLRRQAKICDFGLSRRMYNYTNYVKSQQEPLPWKWMAPESLRDMIFNEKTDVWAYGVTLWEIYSLASNPYPGLSWDVNFSQMLERGLRLSEPEYCERDMFQIIQKCWTIHSADRPTFSEILRMMQQLDH